MAGSQPTRRLIVDRNENVCLGQVISRPVNLFGVSAKLPTEAHTDLRSARPDRVARRAVRVSTVKSADPFTAQSHAALATVAEAVQVWRLIDAARPHRCEEESAESSAAACKRPTLINMSTEPVSRRERVRYVIFEHDTPAAKAFDVMLLGLILFSVLLVMFESVDEYNEQYAAQLQALEWIVTILFTFEYAARLLTVRRPLRYARSFFGVIDLLAILPVYLSFLIPGAQSLLVIRSLRLLRVFRIFKMAHWLSEANYLIRAIRSSSRKIAVFLIVVVLVNVIVGSTMYLIEGPEHGFDSMFRGVYWSIVTMSTVGFGDIAPGTGLGQILAALLMIVGYSVIAVPTGIVSAEVASQQQHRQASCKGCGSAVHSVTARFCDACGFHLDTGEPRSQPGSSMA